MKKIFSILLSFAMVLGMGTVALAEGEDTTPEYKDTPTVVIKKEYKLTNEGTKSPEEEFEFTIKRTSVSDAAVGIVAELNPEKEGETLMPLPTIGTVSYAEGEAGSDNAIKNITITLPEYESVGIYTYTIKEKDGEKAGVTYYDKDIKLVVTVIEQNGKVRVGAIHTESEGTKSDTFPNVYSAGDLEFSKEVTGILGDKTKFFDVTVTLTGVTGKNYDNPYEVSGGTHYDNPKTIAVGTPQTFKIKDGETIKIANLPYDVTYTVVETVPEGYTATYSKFDGVMNTALEKVDITNNKGGTVDTGISLDSIPYILILGLAVLGISGLFIRRRKNANI